MGDARDQLTAFLTSLFKAVEGAPNAALVYTLAIGKDGRASDAYSEENQFIADQMGEADRVGASEVDLAHTAIDIHSTSDKPGARQRQIVRALRDLSKLQGAEDEPYSPTYVRDRTPLKKGQITTRMLRDEFRRDPALPILIGDDIFIRGIRRGVERGEYVYQEGELLCGPGDPAAQISIDEESVVSTMAYAKNTQLWPRKPKDVGGGTGARGDKAEPGKDGPGGAAVRVAGLRGRNLELVEHRVLRRLAKAGVRLSRTVDEKRRGYIVTEDLALTLGLILRTLAPMRSREKMRAVIEGIEAMEREETAYWLGMAMHRPNPRRVLTALRVLLTPANRRRN